jgi:hypothetical protein
MATETFTTPASTPLDYHVILARAEQMIGLLRSRYICDGWHGKGLDEATAERTLRYFRALALVLRMMTRKRRRRFAFS